VRTLEDKTLLFLVIVVSLAFAWILLPFYGAVLWATVLAIVFDPLHRRLLRAMPGRRNLPALLALLIIVTLVILPLTLTAASIVEEVTTLHESIKSGQMNFGRFFQEFLNALPAWATNFLDRFGLTDLSTIQERLTAALVKGSSYIAAQALDIGKGTAGFLLSLGLMLYLLFFLLRDGEAMIKRITHAITLPAEQQGALVSKATAVIRAMFKGTILVAIVQGALGGLIFWILGIHAPVLWAVVMALLSLVPAAGSAVIWLPVALYLLATGSTWQGIVLILYGTFVMGLVDNILRPLLVGKETQMPDYLVLLSTLGGIAIFGLNGFVIGPLIAALFIAVWDMFSASRQSTA
jgi:predicted PurR-regulated permease PerM